MLPIFSPLFAIRGAMPFEKQKGSVNSHQMPDPPHVMNDVSSQHLQHIFSQTSRRRFLANTYLREKCRRQVLRQATTITRQMGAILVYVHGIKKKFGDYSMQIFFGSLHEALSLSDDICESVLRGQHRIGKSYNQRMAISSTVLLLPSRLHRCSVGCTISRCRVKLIIS